MDTNTAFRALRRGWYLPFIGALAAAAVAIYISQTARPVYETSATYVVFPADSGVSDINDTVRTIEDPRARAILGTYVEVLASESIALTASDELALDPAVLEDYQVAAVILPDANIVELTVRGPSPDLLPLLADAIGRTGGARFVELYGLYDILALDAAAVPTDPVNLGPLQVGAMGAAIGILAGGALALLIEVPRERRRREVMGRIDSYGDPGATVTRLPPARDRRAAGTG